MSTATFYALVGTGLIALGLHALFRHAHLLRKILALNVLGSGIFMIFIALAYRGGEGGPDPVPHAMVLTGIVVAVSATGLALALAARFQAETGRTSLEEDARQGENS
ncbi:hypothetical protein DESUT3_06460 [Desulfuromonas versatilis]|uniref:Na+/H+ antiporter subunit C n=1 Tax=Desulfuromonas versatilis TaxID=2802975 RepID=A0ABN6DV00_9BACT|nr:NADH-quinone oxidoreductase subunit K [Desulfuromonas versatilis]BCR03577.1 hypothetical protein DESUT3_06460 [Desulfuromonas versatilis]